MAPGEMFHFTERPGIKPLFTDDTTPDILTASCRILFYLRRIPPLRCYRHTRCLSEHLYQVMEI